MSAVRAWNVPTRPNCRKSPTGVFAASRFTSWSPRAARTTPRCSPPVSALPAASSAPARAAAKSRASRRQHAPRSTELRARAVTRDETHRAGFVVLGGRTNVGKSTLVNRMVGRKVAIVTPRSQTTRRRILGIRSDPDAQIIFVDTPGLHRPRSALDQKMIETARRCLGEGEVVLGVIEASAPLHEGDRAF